MATMSASDIGAQLQQLVDGKVAKGQAHNIVVGIRSSNGDIDAAAASGFADTSGSTDMTPATPYYLASITKMYTAAVVMKLAASSEIKLDTPISAYLPGDLTAGIHIIDGTDYSGQITVSQLFNQTSGLADYFDGKPKGGVSLLDDLKQSHDRALSIEDIVEIVRGLRPKFAPGARSGTKAYYSDTNYALLGSIIETTTSASVADNFQGMIFDPLGLANTYVFDHNQEQPQPGPLYFKDRLIEIPQAMSSFAPDGGVVSTVADSLRFTQAFFGGELLTVDQLSMMTSRWNRIFFPLRYGYGLMRFQLPRLTSPLKAPPDLIGHSGATGSFAFFNEKRDLFVAGTVNQIDKPARPYRLMIEIMKLVN